MDNLRRVKKKVNTDNCTANECDVFLTEFGEGHPEIGQYISKGVQLGKEANKVTIHYKGLLAKSGAGGVSAVIGYGDNSHWHSVHAYPMQKMGGKSFEVTFPVTENPQLHIAFKDEADHWDNNQGKNYNYHLH